MPTNDPPPDPKKGPYEPDPSQVGPDAPPRGAGPNGAEPAGGPPPGPVGGPPPVPLPPAATFTPSPSPSPVARGRVVAVAATAVVLSGIALAVLTQGRSDDTALTGRGPGGAGPDDDVAEEIEASDDLSIDPETGDIQIDMPPIGGGDWNQQPEPGIPDRYTEPVPCNGFSPEVLDQLGSDGNPRRDGLARDHEHEPMWCSFDNVTVITYTFTATDDGDGTAAVWDEYGFELFYDFGIPDLGDGAAVNDGRCDLVVASSNVAVTMWGDGGDPRTCDDYLVGLAEDLVTESLSPPD